MPKRRKLTKTVADWISKKIRTMWHERCAARALATASRTAEQKRRAGRTHKQIIRIAYELARKKFPGKVPAAPRPAVSGFLGDMETYTELVPHEIQEELERAVQADLAKGGKVVARDADGGVLVKMPPGTDVSKMLGRGPDGCPSHDQLPQVVTRARHLGLTGPVVISDADLYDRMVEMGDPREAAIAALGCSTGESQYLGQAFDDLFGG